MLDYIFYHVGTVCPDYKAAEDDTDFPHVIYHHPVVVSFIRVTERGEVRVHTTGIQKLTAEEEVPLIQSFLNLLPEDPKNLITFAGRTFGLQVMYLRGLHRGLDTGRIETWMEKHVDLSEELAPHGRASSLSLYGQLIGFVKRPWLDIQKAWDDGAFDRIYDKVEVDALIIAALYLRLRYCRGRDLSKTMYQDLMRSLLEEFRLRSSLSTMFLKNSNVRKLLNGN